MLTDLKFLYARETAKLDLLPSNLIPRLFFYMHISRLLCKGNLKEFSKTIFQRLYCGGLILWGDFKKFLLKFRQIKYFFSNIQAFHNSHQHLCLHMQCIHECPQ